MLAGLFWSETNGNCRRCLRSDTGRIACATCRDSRASVEVVAQLPEELVVAGGDACIADLVGRVERELRGKFPHRAGVDVARGVIPRVPLCGERHAARDGLLESELAARAIRRGDHVSREVVRTRANARS